MGTSKKSKIKVKFRKLGKKKPNGKNNTPFGTFNTKTKVVEIDPRQTEDELMDTLIHECIHASYPYLEEYAVHSGSSTVAQILWDMGYRRIR